MPYGALLEITETSLSSTNVISSKFKALGIFLLFLFKGFVAGNLVDFRFTQDSYPNQIHPVYSLVSTVKLFWLF